MLNPLLTPEALRILMALASEVLPPLISRLELGSEDWASVTLGDLIDEQNSTKVARLIADLRAAKTLGNG